MAKSGSGKSTKRHYSSRKLKAYPWVGLRDRELLQIRLCDLKVEIGGSPLELAVDRLYREMASRRIRLRPHCWLSDDWFSPDGVPGIAIPFYMAHPRLIRLERMQMLEVEGGTEKWCRQILRHEAGHAIDTAYRLHRRKRYRELFGRYSQPYPEFYRPRPNSKSFVIHLEPNYAQSHPSEDFAETFAVWLDSTQSWRETYRGWPVLKKLEWVDEVMQELAGQPAKVRTRRRVDPLRLIKTTLADHYRQRQERYRINIPKAFEIELLKLFTTESAGPHVTPAAEFLTRHRRELSRAVAQGTGEVRYNIDRLLREMIRHSRELGLMLKVNEAQSLNATMVMLTVQTMNHLHGGHHRVAL